MTFRHVLSAPPLPAPMHAAAASPFPSRYTAKKLLSQNLVSKEEATAIEAMVMLMLLLLLLLLLLFTVFVMLMILVLILTWCSGEEDVR